MKIYEQINIFLIVNKWTLEMLIATEISVKYW